MSDSSIHLINSRSCIYLDVVRDILEADSDSMFHLIRNEVLQLKTVLENKGIEYKSLRAVLSPSKVRKNKEIVLCFEAEAFGDCYGIGIHNIVFPLINKKRSHVIKIGDLLYDANYNIKLGIMEKQIHCTNGAKIKTNRNYYLMYFNNVNQEELAYLDSQLNSINGYIGYCDISSNCPFKDIISNTLIQICIQAKGTMILSHVVPDYSDNDNVNMTGIDFDKYGFSFISVNDAWYNTYLNYKMTSRYVDIDDIKMSLNSVTKSPEDISKYHIFIAPEKYEYILSNKGLITESGLAELTYDEFLLFLNTKLQITTICDMEFKDAANAVLFATTFDYMNPKTRKTYSFLVAFQYKYDEKRLVVTSMY